MNKTLISTMMICGAGFAFSDDVVVNVTGETDETMSLTVFEAGTIEVESVDFIDDIADFKLEKGFCDQLEAVDIDAEGLSINMNIAINGSLSLSSTDGDGGTEVQTFGAVLEDNISLSVDKIDAMCFPEMNDVETPETPEKSEES